MREVKSNSYLDAVDAAESANHEKSVFLANMSHEIRTPINAIVGYSQILAREVEFSDVHKKYLDSIVLSTRHLLSVVNGVLDLSKIEAGHMEVVKTAFDLREMFDSVEAIARGRVGELVILETSYPKFLPQYLSSDEPKLRQIIINLLTNAIKFTEKGSVKLSVDVFEVPGFSLVVTVKDTGCGIAPDDIDKVFQPFEQLNTVVKGGTGLGLTISRKFADMLGGEISLKSTVGEGSEFRLEIPITVSFEHSILPTASIVDGLVGVQKPPKILVADDDQDATFLLSKLLRTVGFEVKTANNGKEAIDRALNWRPSLIIINRQMPVLDGFSAIARIREQFDALAIKIVVVSAVIFEEDRLRCLDMGVDSVMSMPVIEEDLFKEISRLLGVHYVYREEVPTDERKEISEEEIASVTDEQRASFVNEILIGDQDCMLLLIDNLTVQESTKLHIKNLVSGFDYEELLELFGTPSTHQERGIASE